MRLSRLSGRLAELANAAPDGSAHLTEPARAEDGDHDHQDQDRLERPKWPYS
jgi:hypothetical protein